MKSTNPKNDSVDRNQLQKYAEDLAEIYKSEKEKRKELRA